MEGLPVSRVSMGSGAGWAQLASYLEVAARSLEDPEPYIPGSYDEFAAFYLRGELADDQYQTLAEAVADSVRRQMH